MKEYILKCFDSGENKLCSETYDNLPLARMGALLKLKSGDAKIVKIFDKAGEEVYVQNSNFFKHDKSINESDEHEIITKEVIPVAQLTDTPEGESDTAIASIIAQILQDKWEEVDNINSCLISIVDLENSDMLAEILKNIESDTMIHIGELQHALSLISPNAKNIEQGRAEAAQDIVE